jgi:hypothetical protein
MRMTIAGSAFFFDVCHFSRAANVTVAANHTTARQRREAEEPDYAHETSPFLRAKQVQCRVQKRRRRLKSHASRAEEYEIARSLCGFRAGLSAHL